jgi:hypothetical protein
VVILRRGPGQFAGRLPDGLDELAEHNLITFKSHHESLDAWAVKELVGHYVAYRKFVSKSPSKLLPEDRFRLYSVCARFPHNLSGQAPWQERQPGVYDCQWGTDAIRVVVAANLPREAHNAPLHLFSALPGLVGFGRNAYRPHSIKTSTVLELLFHEEGSTVYTIEDFERDVFKRALKKLKPEELRGVIPSLPPEKRREALVSVPLEERLEDLSDDQIRQYLDKRTAERSAKPRKTRRKK